MNSFRHHPYLTVWVVALLLFLSPFLGMRDDGTYTALGEALKVPALLGLAFGAPIVTIRIWLRRSRMKRKAKKEVLARCEYEHRAIMNGDPVGLYGRYTPAQFDEPPSVELAAQHQLPTSAGLLTQSVTAGESQAPIRSPR
ncbi:MAG: hypothetical protein QG597_981 [Actinomycetota bacterium]|nr:hypothetical protein [Actinomycetota bacterium]